MTTPLCGCPRVARVLSRGERRRVGAETRTVRITEHRPGCPYNGSTGTTGPRKLTITRKG